MSELVDELGVLTSTRRVVERARRVRIDSESVERVAQSLAASAEPPVGWDHEHHFVDGTSRTVQYVLVLDTLNFCFWGDPRWEIEHRGAWVNGYWALALSLRRAVELGRPILDASYLARINPVELGDVLDGRGEIPLLEERAANLRELGRVLLERYAGQSSSLVGAARGSAVELVRLLARDFSSFDDTAAYAGERVRFYKRAQICAADLAGSFEGQSWGRFDDLDRLTAFADYKLPQVLRRLDILQYSATLAEHVDRREPLAAGSEPEVEIRAATVWSVELLRRALARLGHVRTATQIDYFLWLLGQTPTADDRPYHLTRTIYY